MGSGVVHKGTKRPSSSSAARRILKISLSREVTQRDQKKKAHRGRVSLCPRTFRARTFPLPVVGGPRRKTQQTFTRARTIPIDIICETHKQNSEKKVKDWNSGANCADAPRKIDEEDANARLQCTLCQPLARQDFLAASKGQERGQRSARPRRRERDVTKDEIRLPGDERKYAKLDTRSTTLISPR